MEDINTKRPLNMEEKKNLQRLLFSEINGGSAKYKAARQKAREQLEKQLLDNAPVAVRKLLAQWIAGRNAQANAEKKCKGTGYYIATYNNPPHLKIEQGQLKQLIAFDQHTAQNEKKIHDLERDFTLRLFADGEEARGLFTALTKELSRLVV